MSLSRQHCGCETCTCGCCEGTEVLTPIPIYNRPGLDVLSYRVGRHGEFLESMKARLASRTFPALKGLKTRDTNDFSIALLDAWATVGDVLTFYQERVANEGYLRTATERQSVLELARLVGYAPRPGVAATVYLAYTLEDAQDTPIPKGSRAQSIPGPGELPQSFETSEKLAAYAKLNTLGLRLRRPQRILADELPEKLYVEGIATNLKAGDKLLLHFGGYVQHQLITVHDIVTDNKANVTLLSFATSTASRRASPSGTVARVRALVAQAKTPSAMGFPVAGAQVELALLNSLLELMTSKELMKRLRTATLPGLETSHASAVASSSAHKARWLAGVITDLKAVMDEQESRLPLLAGLVSALKKPASIPPGSSLRLGRDVTKLYASTSDLIPKLYSTLFPQIKEVAYAALAATPSTNPPPLDRLEVLRVKATLFGHNVPPKQKLIKSQETVDGGELSRTVEVTHIEDDVIADLANAWGERYSGETGELAVLALDAEYASIKPETWLAIERPALDDETMPMDRAISFHQVNSIEVTTLSLFNVSTKVSLIRLDSRWLDHLDLGEETLRRLLTETRVYAAGDILTLAEEPIDGVADDLTGGQDNYLELDDLYRGLAPGRWAIVTGERTDKTLLEAQDKVRAGVSEADLGEAERSTGVMGAELAMISEVAHGFLGINYTFVASDAANSALPGDTLHTFIKLAKPLEYRYKRSTVKIYGNVVKATHGETKTEVLGAGDATQAFQSFALKQPPLTYLAAPTAEGAESTLEVFVNDMQWHVAAHFLGLSKTDRKYVLRIDDDGKTSVVFGNGETGARLPSGLENVRTKYRSGIGKPGNVAAKQISLLASRPLGVKEVINPLLATGGADRESRDAARKNAPKALMALDRLVSVQDYADFAGAFAGIGKASAVELSNGKQQLVHVTVAGADDIRIDKASDLYRNLHQALRALGDPFYPLTLELRTLKLLVIAAKVHILPDHRWETVEPKLRETMLEAFGFDKRELGQHVRQAEVLSVLQGVAGVAYVDLETFGALGADELASGDPASGLGLAETVRVNLARFDLDIGDIRPAELALLSPNVPDTLILELP